MACPRVVAEAAHGRERADRGHGETAGHEEQTLLAQEAAQPALAEPDRDGRDGEAEQEDAELQARERREPGEGEEDQLRPGPGLGERADPGPDCGEREGIGDRLREHEARVEGVGDDERERADGERGPMGDADASSDRVRRQRGEREGRGVHGLHEAIRGLDAADPPGKARQQGLQEGGEVRGAAAHACAVERSERPPERGVEVLVGEVVRRRVQPGEAEPGPEGGGEREEDGADPDAGQRRGGGANGGGVHIRKHRPSVRRP